MYEKKCKYCNKNIIVVKQCLFAIHVANCNSNPNKKIRIENYKKTFTGKELVKRITLNLKCPKCGKEFESIATESTIKRNKHKKYCSIKCANSKDWSDEHKNKLSETCKNSEKVKIANELRVNKNKQSNNNDKYKFVCLYCNEEGYDHRYCKDRKYHADCWIKISGGVKKGSSRGKCGLYKGYWCDSSYELAYVIYNIEHNINIERNKQSYDYILNGKKHKYYPDFRVNGKLVEIKNYRSELTEIKLKSVDEDIEIYYKDSMKPYLEYVIAKYGKNFIKLYETI